MAAATAARSGKPGIFWTNGGVEAALGLGPGSRTLKNGVMKKSGSSFPGVAGAEELNHSTAAGTFLPVAEVTSETSRHRSQVGLKDLCAEDKRRIANLIEELARLNEEKEESVQRLKDEQENFERKIQHLEQQNEVIAQEREGLQQQYRECQELLGLYQQYLSQQQVKLNRSIAQLRQAPSHRRVLGSDEAPSTRTCAASRQLLDGSYLGLAATRARPPPASHHAGGREEVRQPPSKPTTSLSFESGSQTDEPSGRLTTQRDSEESRSSGGGTQRRTRLNGLAVENGPPDAAVHPRLQASDGASLDTKATLTSPLLGHGDWEEKRHQLLLQKMQLEVERERLQAWLAEQEETIHRQKTQLRRARLENARIQDTTQSEETKNGRQQPEGDAHHRLVSSVREDAGSHPAQHKVEETRPPAAAEPRQDHGGPGCEASVHPGLTSTTSVTHKAPEDGLDLSVGDLLDFVLGHSSAPTPKTSLRRPPPPPPAPNPLCRSLLTPSGPRRQSPQQDLEESQILEDIFFIC